MGAPITLAFALEPEQPPLELPGFVVRVIERGFAVHFEKTSEALCRALEAFDVHMEALGRDLEAEGPYPTAAAELGLGECTIPELEGLVARMQAEITRRRQAEEMERRRRDQALQRQRRETQARLREEMCRLAEREGLSVEDLAALIALPLPEEG